MEIRKIKEHWGKAPVFHGDGDTSHIDVPVRAYSLSAVREEIPVGEFPWLRAMLEAREVDLEVHFRTTPDGGVEVLYSSIGDAPEDFPCGEVFWDLKEFCQEAVS